MLKEEYHIKRLKITSEPFVEEDVLTYGDNERKSWFCHIDR